MPAVSTSIEKGKPMYKHLLVPVDGSELSIITVGKAIAFAHALQARLSFLHATLDYSATKDGALRMVLAPDAWPEEALGQTNAILAKAGSAAAAAGLQYRLVSSITDHPHQAILDAAKEQGCDLIFMASHGRKGLSGLLGGSQTDKVLKGAACAVLVASVETNDPETPANRAIAIIQDEHRSLAVVIRGLLHFCGEVEQQRASIDIGLFRSMIRYMREFPGALHHPKEERYLFARLQARTDRFDALIAALTQQHTREAQLVDTLEQALSAFEAGQPDAGAIKGAMDQLAGAIWQHMGAEEQQILPGAREYLREEDWREISAAFSAHRDPFSSGEPGADYAALFTRIANYLPNS